MAERNEIYQIEQDAPDYFMIGQNGDLGFFIKKQYDDSIYALDLGAMGAAQMQYVAWNMADLITKIMSNEDENWQLLDWFQAAWKPNP